MSETHRCSSILDGEPTGLYHDEWRKVWRVVNPGGKAARVWERVMPRLTDDVRECSIYLYKSDIDAHCGETAGGSGFLYEIPFDESISSGKGYIYAVSNWHVVREWPVIRLNSAQTDGFEIIPLTKNDWTQHQDKQTDIAVALLADDPTIYRYRSISPGHVVTKDQIAEFNIGIGDDTFLVGRFVNHEGKQRNEPSVRLGAIAQMPNEKIRTKSGEQEAFLVETKTIAGYSGSPVFVLISERRSPQFREQQGAEPTELFKFLGIECAHLIERLPVYNADGKESGQFIKANTGMGVVIPVWKLTELLESPALKTKRDEVARKRRMEINTVEDSAGVTPPTHGVQATTPKEGEPIEIPVPTEKHFFSDLAKVTRRKRRH